jgi:predicted O-methyltransferase YrrM
MTNEQWHNEVTVKMGGVENYGKGIWPNPFLSSVDEYRRREEQKAFRDGLTRKIEMLTEPRFITGCETSELMEALVSMTDATQLLEVGMHVGRTSLHLLRAIVGKPGAKLVSIDARPSHDREFFSHPRIAEHFEFLEGWTPQIFEQLQGRVFDWVFVDSDHSVEHSERELAALLKITRPGTMLCFHDVPEWQTPTNRQAPPVRLWLQELIRSGRFQGMMLPSPRQLDCAANWGPDYPVQCSPGLAVLIRN